jgi:MoxR-like ATPase
MLLKAEFQAPHVARGPIDRVIESAGSIILGKETQVRLALACMLARGHLLIEDLPGVGKTTLAHVLAKSLGLQFQRIQFTSDMLPAPFFVIATQNPSESVGTFPLPESQLDRFTMRIELGYPDRDAERALLSGTDRRDLLATLDPAMTPAELVELQAGVQRVHVAPALLDYVQAIVQHTRRTPSYVTGLSPRAALALVHCARAWALLEGRDKVLPEDVQAILPGVAAHRLRPAHETARRVDVGAQLLAAVPIP